MELSENLKKIVKFCKQNDIDIHFSNNDSNYDSYSIFPKGKSWKITNNQITIYIETKKEEQIDREEFKTKVFESVE